MTTQSYGRLVATGIVAAFGALTAVTLAAAVARAAGVDFVVSEGDGAVPLSGFAFVTEMFSLVGVVIAVAFLRWSTRPAEWFARTAVALTAVSLVPPFLSDADGVTATTLAGLHLVAAAVMIPILTRSLKAQAELLAAARLIDRGGMP